MVNALKKIKNFALDIVLDIACRDHNVVNNLINFVLGVIGVRERLGWLLAVVVELQGVQDANN